jgi:hypothetical protein
MAATCEWESAKRHVANEEYPSSKDESNVRVCWRLVFSFFKSRAPAPAAGYIV